MVFVEKPIVVYAQNNDNPPIATLTPTRTHTPTRTPSPTRTPTNTPTSTNTPTPTPIIVELPNLPSGAKPLELVWISPGTFKMGRTQYELNMNTDEMPEHEIEITNSFYMGKYEITQAQWESIMGGNPSYFDGNPNHPVEQVTWYDCQLFLKRLNELQLSGYKFRLPTEAEWEYTCRAGTTTRFSFGDALDCTRILEDVFCDLMDPYMWWSGNSDIETKEVGLKLPNDRNVFDMHGNVWEWCHDWYDDGFYSTSPIQNPIGPSSGMYKVIRSGSFLDAAWLCRSTNRGWTLPDNSLPRIGLRIILSMSDVNMFPDEVINVTPTSTPHAIATPTSPQPSRSIVNDKFTKLLLHFDHDFYDSSISGHIPRVYGDAKIDKNESFFGNGSLYLDGDKDYLEFLHNTDFFAEEYTDFTMEVWYKIDGIGVPKSGQHLFESHSGISIYTQNISAKSNTSKADTLSPGNSNISGYSTGDGKWHHIAFVRHSGIYRLYLDGKVIATGDRESQRQEGPSSFLIGTNSKNNDHGFKGWIDEFRYSQGIARYSGEAFEVPTQPFRVNGFTPNYTPTPVQPTPTLTLTPTTIPVIETFTINIPGLPEGAKPLEMIWIEPGSFIMGIDGELEINAHEGPAHRVEITKGYYIGKYEITQAQWMAVRGNNPSLFSGNPNHPVENISWIDCQFFLQELNALGLNELKFRLPSEAEWEYACRAGTTTRYSHGDALDCTFSCIECFEHQKYMWWCGNNRENKTHEVGLKLPNPWGLFDMHGNVWEWCHDLYGYNFYSNSPLQDPQGPSSGTIHVYRGGSWNSEVGFCRSTYRSSVHYIQPGNFGFRCVLSSFELSDIPVLPTFTPTVTATVSPTATVTPTNSYAPLESDSDVESIMIEIPGLPSVAKPLEMVWIEPGTFMMGREDGDESERPVHEVTLTEGFFMGRFEVTQAQWETVMGHNPSRNHINPNKPVVSFEWNDGQKFIEILNKMGLSDFRFRLPTEAEWEYACRAGTTTNFSHGNIQSCTSFYCEPCPEHDQYLWFCGNSGNEPHVVGLKRPNPWGLYDMHGNVTELCNDWKDNSYYSTSPSINPLGPPIASFRLARGGDFRSNPIGCQSTNRYGVTRNNVGNTVGIRLVLSKSDLPNSTPTPTSFPTTTLHDVETITIGLPNLPPDAKPLEMVWIEPGTFMMGSQNIGLDERPSHQVTLTKGFYMGKYEVTQAQWVSLMVFNPSLSKGNSNKPVERVNWNDCQKYLETLNNLRLSELEFRLPTEAEWEYACRAGTTTTFSFGDALECINNDKDCGFLNLYMRGPGNTDDQYPSEVGLKRPNPWGLYDMHGNIGEWCQDWYNENYYANSPLHDPKGPFTGIFRIFRVLRRGGYPSGSAIRDFRSPTDEIETIGFRIVLSQPDIPTFTPTITPTRTPTRTPTNNPTFGPTPTPTPTFSQITNSFQNEIRSGKVGEKIMGLGTLRAIETDPQNRYYITVGSAGALIRSLTSHELISSIGSEVGDVISVSTSDDGNLIAFGNAKGELTLWDYEQKNVKWKQRTGDKAVLSSDFSDETNQIAAGTSWATSPIHIYDVNTAGLVRSITGSLQLYDSVYDYNSALDIYLGSDYVLSTDQSLYFKYLNFEGEIVWTQNLNNSRYYTYRPNYLFSDSYIYPNLPFNLDVINVSTAYPQWIFNGYYIWTNEQKITQSARLSAYLINSFEYPFDMQHIENGFTAIFPNQMIKSTGFNILDTFSDQIKLSFGTLFSSSNSPVIAKPELTKPLGYQLTTSTDSDITYDGNTIIQTTYDHSLIFYHINTNHLEEISVPSSGISDFEVLDDESVLQSYTFPLKRVNSVNLHTGINNPLLDWVVTDQTDLSSADQIALSHNKKLLYVSSGLSNVAEWDIATRTLVGNVAQQSTNITAIAHHPTLPILATGNAKGEINLYYFTLSGVYATNTSHKNAIHSLSFSPNGTYLLSGSADDKAGVWRWFNDEFRMVTSDDFWEITSTGFSSDSRFFALGSSSGKAYVYDTNTLALKAAFEGPEHYVSSVAFSKDGQYLAAGSEDSNIYVWNLNSNEIVYKLDSHNKAVTKVEFIENNQLVSSSQDGTLRVFDISSVSLNITSTPTPTPVPTKGPVGDTITINLPGLQAGAKTMELVWIEPGTFMMGSTVDDTAILEGNNIFIKSDFSDSRPQHEVEISRGFYMGIYEVTNAQFAAFLNQKGNTSPEGEYYVSDYVVENRIQLIDGIWKADTNYLNHPVATVSWYGARDFSAWLQEMLPDFEGRLPSEAEWEYACRAGTTWRFSHGNVGRCDQSIAMECPEHNYFMWYFGTAEFIYNEFTGIRDPKAQEVGLKYLNPWGLYDMHGNVWEWCQDWYANDYYSNSSFVDPNGATSGEKKVIRGGFFEALASQCMSFSRSSERPSININGKIYGFRSVLSPIEDVVNPNQPTPTQQPTFTPTPTPTATNTPSPTITYTPTPVPSARKVDEIVLAQGAGGSSLVQIRNFDTESGQPQNAILDSYRVLSPGLVNRIGGGIDRAVHVSVGDINHDGKDDLIHTFGQVTASSTMPNLVIPMDAATKQVIGHSFTAFPSGNGAVGYASGELFTAVGDFINDGENLLAVAQGIGSRNGLVRLFKYTGNPAPNAWSIVAQFQPLDDRPALNNANGGVTLTAGDVDGDGKDELLAGQTNSNTSLTQFTVIDLDDPGNPVRQNFTAFPPGFRGLGGVELVVADLDGDGQTEIVASSLGNAGTSDIGNVVSVIRLVVVNQQINGFTRPDSSILKVIGDDSLNPGGALHIDSGELDGDSSNGEEIVFSSGIGAPQSFYKVMKINYQPNTGQSGLIESFQFLTGPPRNTNVLLNAFVGDTNPSSGEVIIKIINLF